MMRESQPLLFSRGTLSATIALREKRDREIRRKRAPRLDITRLGVPGEALWSDWGGDGMGVGKRSFMNLHILGDVCSSRLPRGLVGNLAAWYDTRYLQWLISSS